MNEIAKNIHSYLLSQGNTDVPEDFDSFYSQVSSNRGLAQSVYEYIRGVGADVPDTFEDFYSQAFGGGADVKFEDVARANTAADVTQPEAGTIDLSNMVSTRNEEGLITMPFNLRHGGVDLEDWQIDSRLNNKDLTPDMFAKGVDPFSYYAGDVESPESPPDNMKGARSFQDLARMAVNAEEDDQRSGDSGWAVDENGAIVGARFLGYEGNQILKKAIDKERKFREYYKDQYGEEDAIAVGAGMGTVAASTMEGLPAPVAEVAESVEKVLDPEVIGTGTESSYDKKLYDLENKSVIYAKNKDINDYVNALYGQMGVSPEDATPAQSAFVRQKFAERYTSAEVMKKLMQDQGLDPEATGWETAWSSFAGGGLGIGQETAAAGLRLINEWIRTIENIGEAMGLESPNPTDPLSRQRQREQDDWIINNAKGRQRAKILSTIGAYKSNPKYQDDFLRSTLPAAAGSMAGFIVASGGKPVGVGAIGAMSNANTMYEEAVQAGAGYDRVFQTALIGAGVGMTEAIPFERFFAGLSSAGKKTFLGTILKQGAEEGFQESFAAAMNNLTAQQMYDASREIIDGSVLEEGAAGAVLGMVMGLGGAITNKINETRDEKQKAMLEGVKSELDRIVAEAEAKARDGEVAAAPEKTQTVAEEKTPPQVQEQQQEATQVDQGATQPESVDVANAGEAQAEASVTEEEAQAEDVQQQEEVAATPEPVVNGEVVGTHKKGRLEVTARVSIEDGKPVSVTYSSPYAEDVVADVAEVDGKYRILDSEGKPISGEMSAQKALDDAMAKAGIPAQQASQEQSTEPTQEQAAAEPQGLTQTEQAPTEEATQLDVPVQEEGQVPAAEDTEQYTEEQKQRIANRPPLPDEVSSAEIDRSNDDLNKDYYWVVKDPETGEYTVVDDDPRETVFGRRFDNYFDAVSAKGRLEDESTATQNKKPDTEKAGDTGQAGDSFAYDNREYRVGEDGKLRRVRKDGSLGSPLSDSNPAVKAFNKQASEEGSAIDQEPVSDAIERTLSLSGINVDKSKGSVSMSLDDKTLSSKESMQDALDVLEDMIDSIAAGEMTRTDISMQDEMTRLADSIREELSSESQTAGAESEAPIAEEGDGFDRFVNDFVNLGMSREGAEAIRDAVKEKKATPESREAMKSKGFKLAQAKKNSLASMYIEDVYNSKEEKEFRVQQGKGGAATERRREAYTPIQDKLNEKDNREWVKKNIFGTTKEAKKNRDKIKAIKDLFIASKVPLKDAAATLKGMVMADPDVAALWGAITERIRPAVNKLSAGKLSFKSEQDLLDAIASQIIFNPATRTQDGTTKVSSDIVQEKEEGAAEYNVRNSGYKVRNMGEQIVQPSTSGAYEQRKTVTSNTEAAVAAMDDALSDIDSDGVFDEGFVDGFNQRTGSPNFTPETQQAASQTFLSSVVDRLMEAFPGVSVNFTDEVAFADAVQRLHGKNANPDDFRGVVVGNEVHINPKNARLDTPFHEFAHLWVVAVENSAPALYKLMADFARKTAAYVAIRSEVEASGEIRVDEVATREALAQMIGERGAVIWGDTKKGRFSRDMKEALEYHASQQKNIGNRKAGIYYRARPRFLAFMDLMGRFSNAVRRYLGIRAVVDLDNATMADLIDMSATEIIGGKEAVDLATMAAGLPTLKGPRPKEKKGDTGIYRNRKLGANKLVNEAFTIIDDRIQSMQGSFEAPRKRRFLKNWIVTAALHLGNAFDRLGMYERKMEEWGSFTHVNPDGVTLSEELQLIIGRSKHTINQMAHDLFGMTRSRRTAARIAAASQSVIGRMAADKITVAQLDQYMMAKFAAERNQQVREKREEDINGMAALVASLSLKGSKMTPTERAKLTQLKEDLANLSQRGSGMTDEEAKAILDDVDAKGKKDLYDKYAQEVFDTTLGRVFPMLVDSGLMSKEQLEKLLEISENYVPLQVMEYAESWGTSFAFNIEQAEGEGSIFKKLRGTGRFKTAQRTSPTRVMMEQSALIIMLAERNKILLKMKDVIEKNPHERWSVESASYMPVKDAEDNLLMMLKLDDIQENQVPFKDNGVQKYITLHDPDLVKAFMPSGVGRNANNNDAFRFIYRTLGMFQNIRRNLNTVFNPSFPPVAYLADLGMSMALIDQIPGRGLKRQLFREHIGAMKALRQKAWTGEISDPKWKPVFDEMSKAGALISFRDISGISSGLTDYQVEFEKDVYQTNTSSRNDWGKALWQHTGGAVVTALEMQAEVFEMTMRLASYKVARDRGMSPQAAALLAKNITVNFEKKGQSSNFVNSLFLFANAKFQGALNYMTLSIKHKKIMRNNLAVMALGFFVSAMNDVLLGDDDEEYRKVSEEEHRTQMYVAVPGAGDDYLMKFRMPYGMNVFSHGGKLLYDLMSGKKDGWETASEMVLSLEEGLDPLPGSGLQATRLVPDVIKPVFEVAQNRTEFGQRPIMPIEGYGAEEAASRRYFSTVTLPSKAFTDMLSELTGGRYTADGKDYMGGVIELSPEVVDHMIFSYGGGALSEAMNIASLATDGFNINRVPVVRRFWEKTEDKGWRDSKIFWGEVSKAKTRVTPMTDYQLDVFKSTYKSMRSQIDDLKIEKKSKKRKKGSLERNYELVLKMQEERKRGKK
ncbi:LPD38 domain-containing protein [uncultured Sphaerochaeta sp.]|uniref:LPD38 domain-containing protein n=1 Tax=uncultured Sphaerochaeta sp. TaxID=886478 RepID=UPI00260BAA85|nr:LPD38 domain-containing protein [uncultured Sphaerochaeta sp.]